MTHTPPPPTPPSREAMLLRARWLRAMPQEERDQLDELPLREVDRRFAEWSAGRGGDGGASRPV